MKKSRILIPFIVIALSGCNALISLGSSPVSSLNSETPITSDSASQSEDTSKVRVTGISVSSNNVSLTVGETYQIEYVIYPENATNKKVYFDTVDSSISLSSSGLVTALKAGNATAFVSTSDGDFTETITFNIVEANDDSIIHVESISSVKSNYDIEVEDNGKIEINVYPSDATNKEVIFDVDDQDILSVDSQGVYLAKKAGNTVVRVRSVDGNKTCNINFNIKEKNVPVTGVMLSNTSISIDKGQTFTLNANVLPANATNKNVIWSSNDNSIASVSSLGVISAYAMGTTRIYVQTVDGNYQDYCVVKVNDPDYVPPVSDDLTQDDFPNTLYTVTGTSASNTTGSSPVTTYTTSRMSYVNKASDTSNYATIVNSSGTVIRTLKKDLYYTSIDDVANYILAFKELPTNYVIGRNASKYEAYNNYGEYGRLAPGFYGLNQTGSSFDGKDSYPYNTLPKSTSGDYFELDVGYSWFNEDTQAYNNYGASTSYNRGPLRLIVYFDGIRTEGEDLNTSHYNDSNPVIFYTPDHYNTCYEYANYEGGWGKALTKGNATSYTPLNTK